MKVSELQVWGQTEASRLEVYERDTLKLLQCSDPLFENVAYLTPGLLSASADVVRSPPAMWLTTNLIPCWAVSSQASRVHACRKLSLPWPACRVAISIAESQWR